ncbi:hypothetical protein LV82_02398 [Albidovulum inexpectatum]|uniref:DUF4136 domain-containing protein n=1 Tax=Albidovulum inexpectatum TaxID=196587 RepID=A0A2S5JE97_9RHOB|nr:hypothetical protein [Albidovulum inexpectatum]PPB79842.1 hypothetical protein LV82_02398 [Albidovulum inexpectatum]
MPIRHVLALCAVVSLAACAGKDLTQPPEDFGDFRLGYTIVSARQAQTAGPSRKASAEEWEQALKSAIEAQLGRYDGDRFYHVGVGVDAYALAVPGIPVLLSPKSVLRITVNVWDDAAQRKVNPEPKTFTVFEQISPETLIGSGLTQDKQQQITNLSANAAREINEWLVQNREWFTPEAAEERLRLGPQVSSAQAN